MYGQFESDLLQKLAELVIYGEFFIFFFSIFNMEMKYSEEMGRYIVELLDGRGWALYKAKVLRSESGILASADFGEQEESITMNRYYKTSPKGKYNSLSNAPDFILGMLIGSIPLFVRFLDEFVEVVRPVPDYMRYEVFLEKIRELPDADSILS